MASQIHPEGQKFRINASVVARYFKHRCDRLFRWDAVETSYRGRRGIGWNVPSRIRSHSRPGIRLLMDMGDEFEAGTLQTLMQGVGKERVLHAGFEVEGGRTTVAPLPLTELARCLTQRPLPVYIAQLDIDLNEHPTAEAQILRRFGLDLDLVRVGVTRPDLLEVLAPSQAGNPYRLRIWDFKATQAARHEHFVQVGYYSFVLEQVLQVLGFPDIELDTQIGVIYTREGKEEFELAPYRLAVEDFLRNRAPILLSTPAADVHYHMREKCAMCEYMDHCRSEADAHYDLCRIAYLSSESKKLSEKFKNELNGVT